MANNISDEMYEHLREILEKKNKRTYTFDEAREIGDGLIDFYILLFEGTTKDKDGVAPPEDAL